ncbi:hypothetical protein J6590_095787 [Homalodisca vitripennis]|nr:hypothetical protein J6590_095787 [Homalodisca vitripennis]
MSNRNHRTVSSSTSNSELEHKYEADDLLVLHIIKDRFVSCVEDMSKRNHRTVSSCRSVRLTTSELWRMSKEALSSVQNSVKLLYYT